jgi:uncharacterized membrane protein YfcA
MLEELSAIQIAIAVCVVFAAFVVRGMSGFGAGTVGVPLLAFLMPVHTAVALFSLLVVVLFAFLSVRDWGTVVKEELWRLMVPTLIGVAAGVLLFKHLDNRLLQSLLGGFLVVYSIYSLAVHYMGLPQATCTPRWAFPIAFVAAILDTLFGGGGGSLVVIYMHMRGIARAPFRATVAVLWLAEMAARILGYGASGQYTPDVLMGCLLLLPVMAVGSWLGERLGNRISHESFSKLLAVVLLLAGASLLAK